ncbi:Siroheme decarboxylase AhbA [Candidatus Syntrophocurvum alkaliphilum]|uniref:siroheme decarboxylase n=1 Tax=Candidatus Syntrophocurvum alkaliphilum TaxID=2293317 RepID=A0A6I6D9A0_9FIRM|nr:Lrp/AsnC family transcriptional regulator [Candidatus Syntrophocurvum alkaliphilum]QGT99057.1 Siroheme decarboxylase AhbA [Candidatus Syntrophocurvum alkaliphilum]
MNYYNISDNIDSVIINMIQGDIPLESRPFKNLADSLQITEQEVIDRIKKMQHEGTIRRFGAVLRHQKAGFNVNAMVVWNVEESKTDEVGNNMAKFKHVSHCYLRDVEKDFGYNIFTMIHAKTESELDKIIKDISKVTGIVDFKIIRSLKELKKVSMTYI